MSFLVNPLTEKLTDKVFGAPFRCFVRKGKGWVRSIFGQSAGHTTTAGHLPQANSPGSIFGGRLDQSLEQFFGDLMKEYNYTSVKFPNGIKIYRPKEGKITPLDERIAETLGTLRHEMPVHSSPYSSVKKPYVKPKMDEIVRDQAYYDRLGEEIKDGAQFYNPRTGKTTELRGIGGVVVSKDGVQLVRLEKTLHDYRKLTRTHSDGRSYLHGVGGEGGNCTTDLWTVNGWKEWFKSSNNGTQQLRWAPPTRTPVEPS